MEIQTCNAREWNTRSNDRSRGSYFSPLLIAVVEAVSFLKRKHVELHRGLLPPTYSLLLAKTASIRSSLTLPTPASLLLSASRTRLPRLSPRPPVLARLFSANALLTHLLEARSANLFCSVATRRESCRSSGCALSNVRAGFPASRNSRPVVPPANPPRTPHRPHPSKSVCGLPHRRPAQGPYINESAF